MYEFRPLNQATRVTLLTRVLTLARHADRCIFFNESAVLRLVAALLMEQNDEYAIQNLFISLQSIAFLSENPRSGYQPIRNSPDHNEERKHRCARSFGDRPKRAVPG
jgi:hypothetical protein